MRREIALFDPKRTSPVMPHRWKRAAASSGNEARRRTVCEQSALGVSNAAFRRADTTAAGEHLALGFDLAGLWRDGSNQ